MSKDAEEAKYDALLASLADGIIIIGPDRLVTDINSAVTAITGYAKKELLGKRLRQVIKIRHLDGSAIPAASDSKSVKGTYLWTKKDGTELVIDSLTSPFWAGKDLAGTITVIRDVSDQAALDKAKTEFVSLAAHQLRTPLSSVNWYLEMLADDKVGRLSKNQKDYLKEVQMANRRMVHLVNDLLNVSRIDLDSFAIHPEPTDIEETINTVLNELVIQISRKNLHITTAFTGAINRYQIDPQLAAIVLQNLIGNAIKYTPIGGSIDIYAILDSQKLLITIDDTGYGIPVSQQDKIFSKLFRADNVTRRDTEGTGLGLYLVKAIVEKSGGTIDFTSKLNQGTTFSVTFPSGGMKPQSKGQRLALVKKPQY